MHFPLSFLYISSVSKHQGPQWLPLVIAMVGRALQSWPSPSTWVYWLQGAELLVYLPSGFFLPQASNKTAKYSEEQPPCLACQDLEAHCSLWFWFITGVFGMKPRSLSAIVCYILPCTLNHNTRYFFTCVLLLQKLLAGFLCPLLYIPWAHLNA